jgi:hypothetical protein
MVEAGLFVLNMREHPERRAELLMSLASRMVWKKVAVEFGRNDPLRVRIWAVRTIYRALDAEFAHILGNVRAAMAAPAAAAQIRRDYALADAAAVDALRRDVARDSAQGRAQAVADLRAYPERHSVELNGDGPAYRQAVAISIGRRGFD